MKLKQLEYAVTIGRTLSFSKAARELYVSQPNISSAISSLEDELGFQIFERTNQGIRITEKGQDFLARARLICSELQKIGGMNSHDASHTFSVRCVFNHTATSVAFSRLCRFYQKEKKLNFSMDSGSPSEIMDSVYMRKCHLGILLLDRNSLRFYQSMASGRDLQMTTLTNLRFNVNLRQGHPLLEKESFSLEELSSYPLVNYTVNSLHDFPDLFSLGIINPDKIISVHEKDMRSLLVHSTDAFSIGCSYHPLTRNVEGIVSIPITECSYPLVAVQKKSSHFQEETERFLEYFMEELNKLPDTPPCKSP